MRIVAMTNEGQLPMMKNMLNSAKKAGFPMNLFHCYIISTNKEAATYNTQEFQNVTVRKLEVILHNMNLDREVLWIDNDIFLFQNIIEDLRRYPGQFVIQDDLWGFCTGFFLVRSSPLSKLLLQKSIDNLKASTYSTRNDQHAFNEEYKKMIRTSFGLKIEKLPLDEYPNGQVYFNENRKSKAKIVHSNYLTTTAEKVVRFKDCGLWDESDDAFNMVNRYFI
jgi:Nucleotide-diphospho-sugar transferase